jgi:hypothetical protein
MVPIFFFRLGSGGEFMSVEAVAVSQKASQVDDPKQKERPPEPKTSDNDDRSATRELEDGRGKELNVQV